MFLDVPLRLTGQELNLSLVKPGSYANLFIPFVVLYQEDEHVFTYELVTHGAGQEWWKADVGVTDDRVDELGVYQPTSSSTPATDSCRLPFSFECQQGLVGEGGQAGPREFSMLRGKNSTAVQYASSGGETAVPEGKFHLYRFYMRLPPAEDAALAD